MMTRRMDYTKQNSAKQYSNEGLWSFMNLPLNMYWSWDINERGRPWFKQNMMTYIVVKLSKSWGGAGFWVGLVPSSNIGLVDFTIYCCELHQRISYESVIWTNLIILWE